MYIRHGSLLSLSLVIFLCGGCATQPVTSTTAPHLSTVLDALKVQLRNIGTLEARGTSGKDQCGDDGSVDIVATPSDATIEVDTVSSSTYKADAGIPIGGSLVVTPTLTETLLNSVTHVDTFTLNLQPPKGAQVKPEPLRFAVSEHGAVPAGAAAAPPLWSGATDLRVAVLSDLTELASANHEKPCYYPSKLSVNVAFQVTGTTDADMTLKFLSILSAGADYTKVKGYTNKVTIDFDLTGSSAALE